MAGNLISLEVAENEFLTFINSHRGLKNRDWNLPENSDLRKTIITGIESGYIQVEKVGESTTLKYDLEHPIMRGDQPFIKTITFRNRITKTEFNQEKEKALRNSKNLPDDEKAEKTGVYVSAFICQIEPSIFEQLSM